MIPTINKKKATASQSWKIQSDLLSLHPNSPKVYTDSKYLDLEFLAGKDIGHNINSLVEKVTWIFQLRERVINDHQHLTADDIVFWAEKTISKINEFIVYKLNTTKMSSFKDIGDLLTLFINTNLHYVVGWSIGNQATNHMLYALPMNLNEVEAKKEFRFDCVMLGEDGVLVRTVKMCSAVEDMTFGEALTSSKNKKQPRLFLYDSDVKSRLEEISQHWETYADVGYEFILEPCSNVYEGPSDRLYVNNRVKDASKLIDTDAMHATGTFVTDYSNEVQPNSKRAFLNDVYSANVPIFLKAFSRVILEKDYKDKRFDRIVSKPVECTFRTVANLKDSRRYYAYIEHLKPVTKRLDWNNIYYSNKVTTGVIDNLSKLSFDKRNEVVKSVLLSGSPGVGKTLFAEIIASKFKQPLYRVPAGCLGLEFNVVAERLKIVTERLIRWNAILLLDDADLYIASRGDRRVSDQRYGLVSEVLRFLDYQPSTVILTTNLTEGIDHAVVSRSSLRIFMDRLSDDETVLLWRHLCKKYFSQDFIRSDFLYSKSYCLGLSGRDINTILGILYAEYLGLNLKTKEEVQQWLEESISAFAESYDYFSEQTL